MLLFAYVAWHHVDDVPHLSRFPMRLLRRSHHRARQRLRVGTTSLQMLYKPAFSRDLFSSTRSSHVRPRQLRLVVVVQALRQRGS